MDCFYAAIEIRDRPELANSPVAIGGSPANRGVLCTCNYIARQYGPRSAMATEHALKLCPDLVLLPVNMAKYRTVSHEIFKIFHDYTELIEPLSLDEAYLDVSDASHFNNCATLIAKDICKRITKEHLLTASAGVAPNKLIAKIASDWEKPNGITIVKPSHIKAFIAKVPIAKLPGVGKVTLTKMHDLNILSCKNLQQLSLESLIKKFGKFGVQLYQNCRGIDRRNVSNNRKRKSVSVEHTYATDLQSIEQCLAQLPDLIKQLKQRLTRAGNPKIGKQFIKVKFSNFKQTTIETKGYKLNLKQYQDLLCKAHTRQAQPVRLLGVGIQIDDSPNQQQILHGWEPVLETIEQFPDDFKLESYPTDKTFNDL